MNDLIANQKILIVGGTSGVGLDVAKQAKQRGANVIVASRNAKEHAFVLDALPDNSIETYTLDIAAPHEHGRLFEAIGVIDHLVITVRPQVHSAPFLSLDAEEAKKAFDTKFWGPYQLIQGTYGNIRETGSITLTSGIAGEKIYQGASTTILINSATEALCRLLAVELAPLRVNVVSPGFVEPKPEPIGERAKQFPAGRLASSDEIASAYLGIMENQYVTGTVTAVDGGARLI